MEGKPFVNGVKNMAAHFVRWLGLNFQILGKVTKNKINLGFI